MPNYKSVFSALMFVAVGCAAHATPISYIFSVTATTGTLAGTTASGSFSYDSSSITPGLIYAPLTALDFTWNGTHYTQATANTGWLSFDVSGNLNWIGMGSNCGVKSCNLNYRRGDWYITWQPGYASFLYGIPTGTAFGHVVLAPAPPPQVPEPLTLSLFAAGLAGSFWTVRRAKRRPAR